MTSVILAAHLCVGAVDMAQADSPAHTAIAVMCIGQGNVTADRLGTLCTDLHAALSARYPTRQFTLSDAGPGATAIGVTLDAFRASTSTLDAQLTWQAQGRDSVAGPRMGFSITDQDMTPPMQLQFVKRLVLDTPLPF